MNRARLEIALLHAERLVETLRAELDGNAGDETMSTRDAAEAFGLKLDTVRWLCRHKGIGRRHGRSWAVDRRALSAYVAESLQGPIRE